MMLDKNFKYVMYISLVLATIASFVLSYRNYFHYEFDEEVKKPIEVAEMTEAQLAESIKSANLDSTNSLLQLRTARMLLESNKADKAVQFYHRYEKLDTMTADLFAEVGTVMWLAKPSAKSVMYFAKALKIDSINAGALFGMGRAILQIGDTERAKAKFQKIVRYHKGEQIADIASDWIKNIERTKDTQEK